MQNYQLQLLKMFKFKSVGILQFRILFSAADKHICQYVQVETCKRDISDKLLLIIDVQFFGLYTV